MIPSPTEIKQSIADRFHLLVDNLNLYRASCRALINIGAAVDDDAGSLRALVIAVYTDALREIAKSLSYQYTRESPINIVASFKQIEFLSAGFKHRDIRAELCDSDNKSMVLQKQAVDAVLNVIDFEYIYSEFVTQIDSIHERSLAIHSDSLIHSLRMQFEHISVRTTSRYVAISRRSTSYWYCREYIEEFNVFCSALVEVKKETGFHFGTGAQDFKLAMDRLSSNVEIIPQRSSFGDPSKLEIYTYKNKYEIRVSHAALNAIQAFILIYGSDENRNCLDRFIDKLNDSKAA